MTVDVNTIPAAAIETMEEKVAEVWNRNRRQPSPAEAARISQVGVKIRVIGQAWLGVDHGVLRRRAHAEVVGDDVPVVEQDREIHAEFADLLAASGSVGVGTLEQFFQHFLCERAGLLLIEDGELGIDLEFVPGEGSVTFHVEHVGRSGAARGRGGRARSGS